MKTLKQITLTAVMIVVSSQMIMAESFKTFKLEISAGRFVEVLTRVESLIEEEVVAVNASTPENNATMRILELPIKEEELLDEELPGVERENNSQVFVNLMPVLAEIRKPESLMVENDIDTRMVFESVQAENIHRLDKKTLAQLSKHESELDEDTFAHINLMLSAK